MNEPAIEEHGVVKFLGEAAGKVEAFVDLAVRQRGSPDHVVEVPQRFAQCFHPRWLDLRPQVIIVPGLAAPPSYDGVRRRTVAHGVPTELALRGSRVRYATRLRTGSRPLPDQYGSPHPPVYSGRGAPPAPDRYPGPYAPQVY